MFCEAHCTASLCMKCAVCEVHYYFSKYLILQNSLEYQISWLCRAEMFSLEQVIYTLYINVQYRSCSIATSDDTDHLYLYSTWTNSFVCLRYTINVHASLLLPMEEGVGTLYHRKKVKDWSLEKIPLPPRQKCCSIYGGASVPDQRFSRPTWCLENEPRTVTG